MNDIPIRIVSLAPVRVASFYGFGSQPEDEAVLKLHTWAGPLGYLDPSGEHRIFGFNNPSPSPGSPNYGYEVWITVGSEVPSTGEGEIKDFTGGLYAVLNWDGNGNPNDTIPDTWRKLVLWRENSPYQTGEHQWLEEHLPGREGSDNPFSLDLYLPIAE